MDGENGRSHIMTLCLQYDELDEIYSQRPSVVIPANIDTGNFELERRFKKIILEHVLNEIDDYSYDYDFNEVFLDNTENEPPNKPSNADISNKENEVYVN